MIFIMTWELERSTPSDVRLKAAEALRDLARQLESAAEIYLNEWAEQNLLNLQSKLASIQFAAMALTSPTITVGSCALCGGDLTFRGRRDGLYVCCDGTEEHCWKVA
jgi:CHASE3 domain sensor protein